MVSLYDVSVPVFIRGFESLSGVLAKGAAHAGAVGIDPRSLIDARLAPDMLPLSGQVQRASDTAKGCAMRLAGREVPAMADEETTFAELQDRIARTVAVLRTVEPEALEGAEEREVTLPLREPITFTGQAYVLGFALPNFYFHVTTAYAILRHNGVAIGKRDFIGRR